MRKSVIDSTSHTLILQMNALVLKRQFDEALCFFHLKCSNLSAFVFVEDPNEMIPTTGAQQIACRILLFCNILLQRCE